MRRKTFIKFAQKHFDLPDNFEVREFSLDKQVEMIEKQINSAQPPLSLAEKMAFLNECYGDDPSISRRALDIVRSNIAKQLPR